MSGEFALSCTFWNSRYSYCCPRTLSNSGCKTVCESLCELDTGGTNQVTCELYLGCFDGATAHNYITGTAACVKVSPPPADLSNAPVSGVAACIPTCKDWCDTNFASAQPGDKTICTNAIPCYDLSSSDLVDACASWCTDNPAYGYICTEKLACNAKYGVATCENYMYGTAGCTFAQCEAWCDDASRSCPTVCTDGKYEKCSTEPCKHKILTAPTDALYCVSSLCDAWCGATPCDAAHKPDCESQCTTWCTSHADDELCAGDEPEDGGFSVVVSLLLILLALL